MEKESVDFIRENSRSLLFMNRRRQKDEDTDVRRSLSNMRISCNVSDIANKLKTKSAVLASELQMLKNVLMADPKNIDVVLNINGALRGLVREISGHDVSKQCASAGCLCNLSLGDARTGGVVAKAAGPYLITALDTLTTELAVTCAWTLGNLAGSGVKACELLTLQGAIAKLTGLLHTTSVQEAAVYALTHFAYMLKDDLRLEHLTMILQKLYQMDITASSAELLFILSCHKEFSGGVPEKYLQNILLKMSSVMEEYLNSTNATSCRELVYLLRTLANLSGEGNSEFIVSYFEKNNVDFKRLLLLGGIQKSLLWFLGNLFKYSSDSLFFKELLTI